MFFVSTQKEIEELECENRLHSPQESMLKVELHNMERTQKREGVDVTYLKNVILKLLKQLEEEFLYYWNYGVFYLLGVPSGVLTFLFLHTGIIRHV
ncbi:protein GRIP isoform X2 [Prunus yedoensis var. nudiflora]|uniref:Protein GRIP isoform X2 n=1 Tax=Prunus yedoensis var. nudiflora TaxID=2094558 RepID=A0A314XHH5_PRUYE|nr:protein GRIP isoform X2 [Prunus yedoensis var. nudiflora]